MLKGCKSVQYFITDGATPVTFTKAENSHGTRKRLHLQRTQDMQQALHNVALESPLQVASSSKKYPNFSFSSRFEVLPRVSLTYQLICIRVVGFSASGRPLQYQGRECCLFPKGLVLGLKEVHRAVMGKIEGHTCCCAPEEAGARRLHTCVEQPWCRNRCCRCCCPFTFGSGLKARFTACQEKQEKNGNAAGCCSSSSYAAAAVAIARLFLPRP